MNSIEKIRVEEFDWNEQMERSVCELRTRVWEAVFGRSIESQNPIEPLDRKARHWGAFNGGRLVGSSRLSIHEFIDEVPESYIIETALTHPAPSPIGSLNRLVVDPEYRKQGIGKRLDSERIQAAKTVGCRVVVGSTPSGTKRTTQLLNLGFILAGKGPIYPDNKCCSGKASEVFVLSFSEGDCLEDAEY